MACTLPSCFLASDVGGGETRVLSSDFPKRGWWRTRRRECERNEGISLAVGFGIWMKVTTTIMEFAATTCLSETRFLLTMKLGLIGLAQTQCIHFRIRCTPSLLSAHHIDIKKAKISFLSVQHSCCLRRSEKKKTERSL